eukprot:2789653-Pyramimonas_sp.AAC.1
MELEEPSWAVKRKEEIGAAASRDAKEARLLEALGEESQSKQKGGKGGALAALLLVLTKLVLTNARELAEVTGACFTCYMVCAGVAFVKVLQGAGRACAESCKAGGKGHKYGPPWPH